MTIAVLAWGSLYWEPGGEFTNWIELPWQTEGPTLKLEFSRVSKSRSGALTLVIDQDNGSDTPVLWCLSRRGRLEDAVADLRCREGTTMNRIACVRLDQQPATPSAPEKTIIGWARKRQLDAVVWTALQSNFRKEAKGIPFSLENAIAYLKKLPPEGKAKAAEYVWRAPDVVKTPLRAALEQEPWFSQPDSN